MKSKKSFNNILFRMLILISAIPMLFISLSVIVMEVSDYYDRANEESVLYLNNISEIIDNYYYESIDIINDFTEEVAIEDYESYDIIQNVINKYLMERQSVYKIYIGFSNGKSYFADRQYTADIYDPRVCLGLKIQRTVQLK